MNIFSWLLALLSTWWIWSPIVAILLYLTFQNNRRTKHVASSEHVLLKLDIPRDNAQETQAAVQLFTSLHNILRSKKELAAAGELQEHISFEIVAANQKVHFYVWAPKQLQSFVESQIYTHYPDIDVQVSAHDYAAAPLENLVFRMAEIGLRDNQALPIKTYESFDKDPLQSLVTVLSKLDDPDEQYWLQIAVRPTNNRWHYRSQNFVNRLKNGGQPLEVTAVTTALMTFVRAFWQAPQSSSPTLSAKAQDQIAAAEQKATQSGFQTKIRVAYIGEKNAIGHMRVNAVLHTLKQYDLTHANGLLAKKQVQGHDALHTYRARLFANKGFVLNPTELGTIFHLPHHNTAAAGIAWAKNKALEPPASLPIITGNAQNDAHISAFATTHFKGQHQQFGAHRSDRNRHVYIIGQTGVGKSKLLELFALSDLFHGQGYAIIDPHGDFAMDNLHFVPPARVNDVVYFNPADTSFPLGFNPMELSDPSLKGRVSTELMNVVRPLFGDTWNTRLEYMLRYIILALLETPGTTMCDITRMITDTAFRQHIAANVADPAVRAFWDDDFIIWQRSYESQTVSPILNKIGSFTGNPLIRSIIGQPRSSFNFRHIMDEGKIFIANTSGALLGEENAALLGSLLITKIQQAAMSRTDPQARRPFYLYVDEFQNFATDSFVPILSEARKYGLYLTMANQYIGQMSPVVRDAVFGNVGTMIVFRIGPDDAAQLAEYFSPQFTPKDLTELHNRHFVIAMTIKGEKASAFSGTTLALPAPRQSFLSDIIAATRSLHIQTKIEQDTPQPMAPMPKPTSAFLPNELPSPQAQESSAQPAGDRVVQEEDVLLKAAQNAPQEATVAPQRYVDPQYDFRIR